VSKTDDDSIFVCRKTIRIQQEFLFYKQIAIVSNELLLFTNDNLSEGTRLYIFK